MNSRDHFYMARAISLAAKGLYSTDPNPRVGCVIVNDDEIVGEGWHEFAGGPHAEIRALERAGERARGATAYVSLEPCSHHGRTPPCTRALIEAGVVRVVGAMEDPNPRVSGQGFAGLREAGITVENGLLAEQAGQLNPGFVMRMRRRRPYVRCKIAASCDGRTAMAGGESKWITSAAARLDVQRLRARSSAVLTGIGTVMSDDPALTVREQELAEEIRSVGKLPVRQPLCVVVDSHLRIPTAARVLDHPGGVLIAAAGADAGRRDTLQRPGVTVEVLPRSVDGGVELHVLMGELAGRGVNELLVEAGATLNGALLHAGLVDELVIYLAPRLMGDAARGMFHLPGLQRLDQSIQLVFSDVRAVGRDLRVTARPAAAGAPVHP